MRNSAWHFSRRGVAFGAAIALFAATAQAVVITDSSNANALGPADDPGWQNMAVMGNGSAVYLGNRWIITANHVSDKSVVFADGRSFALSTNSDVTLSNTFGLGSTVDLKMTQLAADPGLPGLTVAATSPAQGTQVMMIGAGHARQPSASTWSVSSTSVWTPTPLPFANTLGYTIDPSSPNQLHWGVNLVATTSQIGSDGVTVSYSTRFNRPSFAFQAQAVVGDSGGGVFERSHGGWQLTGIMNSIQTLPGQPANTAVFGDQTFIADLSAYHDQIVSLVSHVNSAWRNPSNIDDVDNSGTVDPFDALLIINELLKSGPHALMGTPSHEFLDTNGDGSVTSADVLNVVNALQAGQANSTPSAANLVPEPSTIVLAWCALSLLVLAIRIRFGRASRLFPLGRH